MRRFGFIIPVHPENERGDARRLNLLADTVASLSAQFYPHWVAAFVGRRTGKWEHVLEADCRCAPLFDDGKTNGTKGQRIRLGYRAMGRWAAPDDWVARLDDDDLVGGQGISHVQGDETPGALLYRDPSHLMVDAASGSWLYSLRTWTPNTTWMRYGACREFIAGQHDKFGRFVERDRQRTLPEGTWLYARVLHGRSVSRLVLGDPSLSPERYRRMALPEAPHGFDGGPYPKG